MSTEKRLRILIAVLLLVASVVLLIAIPCPTASQYSVLHVILSICAGGLISSVAGGYIIVRYKGLIEAGGGLAVFFLVFWFTPKLIDLTDKCKNLDDPFTLTVYVHGENGLDDLVLRDRGHVTMDLGGHRQVEKINENGEAVFLGIPPKFHQTPVYVNILQEQGVVYKSADTNSIIIGSRTDIYIKIIPDGLDEISGQVRDVNNRPLRDVLISIQGIRKETDSLGEFIITIPKDKQQVEQELTALKKGYETSDVLVYPATKQKVGIILKRLF